MCTLVSLLISLCISAGLGQVRLVSLLSQQEKVSWTWTTWAVSLAFFLRVVEKKRFRAFGYTSWNGMKKRSGEFSWEDSSADISIPGQTKIPFHNRPFSNSNCGLYWKSVSPCCLQFSNTIKPLTVCVPLQSNFWLFLIFMAGLPHSAISIL